MIAIHSVELATRRTDDHLLRVPDRKRRAFAFIRSRFEELLGVFRTVFVHQKNKLREQVEHVEGVMQELEKLAARVAIQLAREVDGDTQLKDATHAVVESADALKELELVEREAKRAFLLDEQRCAVLQSEIEREREVIQQELAKTLPDLLQATASLAQINKHHITELKSFTNPPQLVRLVMQAVCVLLGSAPTWAEALRVLADIRFLDRLRSFDRDRVDPVLIERVQLYTHHPDFSMENMKRASLASTTLCKWVLAIVRYFEVMKHVAPTQEQLASAERSFQAVAELVQAERQKLIDLELQMNELRAAYVRATQVEEELQRSHDSRVKWTSTVSDFADVLASWREYVARRHQRLRARQTALVEHCVLVAVLLVDGTAATPDERTRMLNTWTSIVRGHMRGKRDDQSVDASTSIGDMLVTLSAVVKHWTLSGPAMAAELIHALASQRFADTPSTVESLFLADQVQKVCLRYPLLFDPLGDAAVWLRDRFALSGSTFSQSMAAIPLESASGAQQRDEQAAATGPTLLLVLDAGDPSLMSTIEKQMTQKAVPLVRLTAVSCLSVYLLWRLTLVVSSRSWSRTRRSVTKAC